jgi:hypothetical protein
MAKAKPLVKIVTRKYHWSDYFVDQHDACSVPDHIAACATPEIAWRAAEMGDIRWLKERAGFKMNKTQLKVYKEAINTDDAKLFRKVMPNAPVDLVKRIHDWCKDGKDVSHNCDDLAR